MILGKKGSVNQNLPISIDGIFLFSISVLDSFGCSKTVLTAFSFYA
jgi:hypothetical protein